MVLTTQDVQELIEYKDVFKKFIRKSIVSIQCDLFNCKLMWKEPEAYATIRAYKILQDNLDNIEKIVIKEREKSNKKEQ